MWSNHGKETARHRIRVLSSSPAYWPNGVALKKPKQGKRTELTMNERGRD